MIDTICKLVISQRFSAPGQFLFCFEKQGGYQVYHYTSAFAYTDSSRIIFFLAPVYEIFIAQGSQICQWFQEIVEITFALTVVIIVEQFVLLCISFVIVQQGAQYIGTAFAGYLDHFIGYTTNAVTNNTATQQYLQGRKCFPGALHRAAVEADGCNTMLAAGVHTATDLDLNVFIIYQIGEFFRDHFF